MSFPPQYRIHIHLIWFSFSSGQHNYDTSSSTQGNLMKPFFLRQIDMISAAESWNKIQKQLKNMLPPIKSNINSSFDHAKI